MMYSTSHYLVDHKEACIDTDDLYYRICTACNTSAEAMTCDLNSYLRTADHNLMLCTQQQIEAQQQFCKVYVKAVCAIINKFSSDDRIQTLFNLSPSFRDIIIEANKKTPYSPECMGTFRPDFLIDDVGHPRVCEVNARFPLNGYLSTHLFASNVAGASKHRFTGVPNTTTLTHDVIDFFKLYSSPVVIVKGKEHGYDVHLLAILLRQAKREHVFIEPAQLVMDNGLLCYRSERSHDMVPIKQVYLELHQEELAQLHPDILKQFTNTVDFPCLNDLRTILLVHDKRMLVALTSSDIMNDLVVNEEWQILLSNIIPTYAINVYSKVVEQARIRPQDWVLKPATLGKGEGILFGKNYVHSFVDQHTKNGLYTTEWIDTLQDSGYLRYVIQPYIKQLQFGVRDQTHNIHQQSIVGMILAFNGKYYGPGFFRSSPSDAVAISRGGCAIIPCVQPNP